MISKDHIRNFCIIAHIDHGKSTLADRILEATQTIEKNKMQDQVLDNMDLERERGITIKAHSIRIRYQYLGVEYSLNLIDTPGHVDFAYEVSRSLAACEGAILVVDVSQGVEAQTISNLYMALENNLTIVPVLNKIDLPGADIDGSKKQLIELLGIEPTEFILASAKMGQGIDEILKRVIERIPSPRGNEEGPLRALIFDSQYDQFRGVVFTVRVVDGQLQKGDSVILMHTGMNYVAEEVGILRMNREPRSLLSTGEVGYVIPNIKNVHEVKVGDTITLTREPAVLPLTGYREVKPMVFCGMYPIHSEDFDQLRFSFEKLSLNDSSFSYEPETSKALGFGFRCGFLGQLHMDIIQERLSREYQANIIATAPNVKYKIVHQNLKEEFIDNPTKLPQHRLFDHLEEPYIKGQIVVRPEYVGNVMKLSQEKRGIYQSMEYLDQNTVLLKYEFPLAEVIFEYHDRLKSVTKGYGSFDYEFIDYRLSDLVKMDIFLNGEPMDAFTMIIHRDKAYYYGRELTEKLKDLIPRQMFEVAVQAAIDGRIIARSTIKALRKNVTAKCYGGDITRKRKLLERQKEGKKRMKTVGKVEIPQEAFLAVLQIQQE